MCLALLSIHLLQFGGEFPPSVFVSPSGGDDRGFTCSSGFNLFGGDGIVVAAVSSEMALTGRSHSDNNKAPFPYVPSRLTFFYTQLSLSLPLFLILPFPPATSYFP